MVIPARSGSRGITDKNIKKLGELPLLCWSARAAELAAVSDSMLILSTDSEKYAAIGKQYGLTVPFIRPAEHAKDMSSAFAAASHALSWFKTEYGYYPERLMWLQPTSPFRSPEVINEAVEIMDNSNVEAVIGCQTLDRDLTTLFTQQHNTIKPLSDAPTQTCRQNNTALVTPNGALYLIKTQSLLKTGSFYPENKSALLMDKIMSHDIDEPVDWQIALAYYTAKLGWMGRKEYE